MTDKTPGACQCHEKHAPTYWKGVVREYKDALDKAEQERDHFQEVASTFRAKFNEADARAEQAEQDKEWWIKRTELFSQMYHGTLLRQKAAEQPRPLTPDAITDEMVERGRSAYWGPTYGSSVVGRVRAILAAALTEPPKRPEGAERFDPVVDAAIRGYSDITSPDVVRAISDAIAEGLADPARKEA